jgi:hypothetical protein
MCLMANQTQKADQLIRQTMKINQLMGHKQAISQSIDRNNDNFKYTDTNIIFQILISFIFWTFIEELRINMCMHQIKIDQ